MGAETYAVPPPVSRPPAGEGCPVVLSGVAYAGHANLPEVEVGRLRAMLDAIGRGARELSTGRDLYEKCRPFLASLGQATAVSRVTLFETHDDSSGSPVESCCCDWAEPGLALLSRDPRYWDMPISDQVGGGLDDWSRRRQRGEVVGALLSETSGYTRRVFEEHGTKSFISVPVHVDGVWWGFLGFDDCHMERRWSELEIELLRTSAALVAGGIARVKAQQRLRESEERYALAAHGANDGLWDWDLSSGRTYYSPRLCRVLGRSKSAMGERIEPLSAILVPGEDADFKSFLERCFTERRRKFEVECRVKPIDPTHPNSPPQWVIVRGSIVWRVGAPGRVVGGLRDISARKRIQLELIDRTKQLERSRRLLRAVIDAVPAVINVKDLESRYLLMNRFQGALYGVDPEAALGHTSADFTGEAYGGHSRDLDRAVIESGQAQPFTEREFVDVNGRPHTWYTAKMPLFGGSGTVDSVVTVALEISQLKALERARADLTRYVAPAAAEVLASQSEPFGPPRVQKVAILFADIVQSSRLAQTLTPAEFFALLRECHARLARTVFDHHGALDKFTGDGIMATFGSPRQGRQDAHSALACARAIQQCFWEWNRTRIAGGHLPIRIAIGLHYGPALLGNIGDESRMEFAVLGDTVIVASRLEKLARPLDAGIVVSDALIAAAREQVAETGLGVADDLDGLMAAGPQSLPGRDEPIPVWILPRTLPTAT